jgi:hypothetical protein
MFVVNSLLFVAFLKEGSPLMTNAITNMNTKPNNNPIFASEVIQALHRSCNALGSVRKLDLASSGLFSAWLHPAPSSIKPISPASPSLPGEKPLALGPTTEFLDKA